MFSKERNGGAKVHPAARKTQRVTEAARCALDAR
jgi:hypothetical protein